jgi:transcriptional antiterminator NusG
LEEESQDKDKLNLEQASTEQPESENPLEKISSEDLEQMYQKLQTEYAATPSEDIQKKLSEISIEINDRKIRESMEEPKEEQKASEPAAQQVPEPAAQQVPEPAAQQVPEPAAQQVPEPASPEPSVQQQETEPAAPEEPKEEINSHLFAIRTTGGQEKVVMNLLQNKVNAQKINLQSVLLVDNLKGYVVIEAIDTAQAFNAIQGIRHIRGQLRGELSFKDIEGYLIKKSTVSELAVDKTVEIIGGPFKGMKATVTRVDQDKEEATVILLDAPYQLPVTVDANYLKLVPT